jgi:Flp pilus assembly protein TadD
MIEHGACLVDMCSSDDVERTRIVTKLITAISEADTLREPLLARWPALNAGIIKLAAHADRETAMFANMALTLLVQPAANKVSLKDAGLLDFLRTATKSTDMELVAYAANIMANWAFELPAATIKFSMLFFFFFFFLFSSLPCWFLHGVFADSDLLFLVVCAAPEQKDMLKNSLMQMAEMFVSTGLHEAALLALQELQKLEPNQAFWHNLLGKVLSTLHRYDEANAHFRDCIRLNPQILEAHHLLAQNLSRSSSSPADQAEAVTVARRCLESADAYPSLPDVHVLLVDTLHSAGQYRAAVQAAEAGCRDVRVKKGSAPYGRLLLLKGRAMFRLGDVVGAEKTLTEASKLVCRFCWLFVEFFSFCLTHSICSWVRTLVRCIISRTCWNTRSVTTTLCRTSRRRCD